MDSDWDTLDIVLRTSCLLSITGSLVVMLVCRYPESNRKRSATQLIFWLSFADFCTAVVYLFASFEAHKDKNTPWCQTTALLGIFFPVASFLWTDFIAFYLYSLIMWNRFRSSDDWDRTMKKFHLYAWGTALLCIVLVASFGRAGKDEDSSDNTGGWCWVQAPDKTQLFMWELVGGKLVEWSSAFIILPYLYAASAYRLVTLENMSKVADTYVGAGRSGSSVTSLVQSPESSFRVTSGEMSPTASRSESSFSNRNGLQFKQFYVKMAMVPLVFFFIRFWGSIRAILYFAYSSDNGHYNGTGGWLKYMQAIFDPSQGFFNALLFVVTSSEGRQNVVQAWNYLCRYYRLMLAALCPCTQKAKKRNDSNIDSAEMTSGTTADGFLNSLKKENQNGLRDVLNTSAFESSTMPATSEAHTYGDYGVSEIQIESTFSLEEGGHRLSSKDVRDPNHLDFLTVPENVTVHALVRNSMKSDMP